MTLPRRPLTARPLRTRRARALVGVAVAWLALVAASATPCEACSCAQEPTVGASAQRADVVFVGTLVDTRSPALSVPGAALSEDPVARVFEVREVRKGDTAARTEVLTAASGASCGLEVEQGRTYVVVARSTPDGLTSGLCDGTRLLSAVAPTDLDAVGAATSPRDGSLPADLPALSPTVGEVAGAPAVWGPGLAVVAGAVVLLVVLRRRRRAT